MPFVVMILVDLTLREDFRTARPITRDERSWGLDTCVDPLAPDKVHWSRWWLGVLLLLRCCFRLLRIFLVRKSGPSAYLRNAWLQLPPLWGRVPRCRSHIVLMRTCNTSSALFRGSNCIAHTVSVSQNNRKKTLLALKAFLGIVGVIESFVAVILIDVPESSNIFQGIALCWGAEDSTTLTGRSLNHRLCIRTRLQPLNWVPRNPLGDGIEWNNWRMVILQKWSSDLSEAARLFRLAKFALLETIFVAESGVKTIILVWTTLHT